MAWLRHWKQYKLFFVIVVRRHALKWRLVPRTVTMSKTSCISCAGIEIRREEDE